jgi:folate-binding protein YgfZ
LSEIDQLRYAREGAGLLVGSPWRRIRAEGRDALDYLHRRLSQSIKKIPDGGGAHALQLDGAGFMLADLLVYRRGASADLLSHADSAQAAYEVLEKYTLMDDVSLSPCWEMEELFALIGPQAETVIEKLSGTRPAPDAWCAFDARIADQGCSIFRDGRWSLPFFHIAAGKERADFVRDFLIAACRSTGGCEISPDVYEFLRIENGVTQFGLDTTAKTIPLDGGLYDAVDFDKGCFPGQEILARINNLGHPAHRLARFEIPGEHTIEPGAAVLAERVASQKILNEESHAGRITSSRTLPGAGCTLALGFLQWKFHGAREAAVVGSEGLLTAKVIPLGPVRDMSKAKRAV